MQTYPTGYTESHRMAEKIFREILPRHSMAVREEQIALCHEVLDTLYNKEISLCEAGVGIGKTLAYLVACVLWQMNRPEQMKLPIVISTSSVALQDAILTEYLPDLSAILLDEGIITAPITAVVRKGKERFVCDARLAERASLVHPKRTREKSSLHIAENILDMDHIPELSRYDRCRICVPQSCPRDCFMRLDCRYQQYLRDSMKPDIQICNHNYLLADASHRQEDRPLLLHSYQALVVDEAHKLPDAARQMYTETLSPHNMDELCLLLQQAHYKDFARQMRTAFLTLSFSCTQGHSKLRRKVSEPFVLTPFRRAALIDCIALLQNAGGLPDVPRYLLNRLGEAESLLRLFLLEVPTRILFYAYTEGQSFKEIAEYLTTSGTAYHFSDNSWNKNIVARILANEIYCGAKGYPAIISKEVYSQAASIRSNKTVTYSAVLKPFRSDMQCACCGERLYWRPRTQQWTCRQCGMWSKPMQPENMAQQIVDRLYQIQQHPEIIHNPKEQCNTRSIEVAQLDHEIHTALALPELDADAIIDKILRRAELQFNYCAAGDDDPTTMQIKRACKEFKPTDTFPESFYSSIVSKIILHLDTHIDIKLRNGQTL